MDDLSNLLFEADKICNRAYAYYEKANNMRQQRFQKYRQVNAVLSSLAIVLIFAALILTVISRRRIPIAYSFVALGIIGAVYYALYYVVKKSYLKQLEKAKRIEEKGRAVLDDNNASLSFLPDDYWYPLATTYLYKVVSSERADTLKEALAMFDEQLHRWKMERSNSELARQLSYQTQALQGIQDSVDFNTMSRLYFHR